MPIGITLELNPTRFWAHQQEDEPAELAHIPPEQCLAINPTARQRIIEQTLDNSDNCLIDVGKLGGETFTSRQQLWQSIIECYLDKVASLLHVSFSPANSNIVVQQIAFNAVRQGEIYWELGHPNPTSFIIGLATHLRRYDGQTLSIVKFTQGGYGNAEWIRLDLTDDISLTIYAKTASRIRFEVTYKKRRLAQEARLQTGVAASDTIGVLIDACQGAAGRIAPVWRLIQTTYQPFEHEAEFINFMDIVHRYFPEAEEETRALVITLLSARGNVVSTGETGAFPIALLRRLVRAGLLMRVGMRSRSSVFALTPQYQALMNRINGFNEL